MKNQFPSNFPRLMSLRLPALVFTLLTPHIGRAATSALPTIDLIEVSTRSAALPQSYNPGGSFLLLVEESANVFLSTGEKGIFGAGGSSGSSTTFVSTMSSGGQLQFVFNPITGNKFYERASFSSPLPYVRTGFRLDLTGPVTLTALSGSYNAVLSGNLRVARNGLQAPFAGTDAAVLGAAEGELIPFSVTYTRLGSPWSATSFQSPFNYTFNAELVTAAIPEPGTMACFAIACAVAATKRKRPKV
jgi:hypothetical protein